MQNIQTKISRTDEITELKSAMKNQNKDVLALGTKD
jgi:hypothetical protein